ncbi:MAG: PEP/pyruvate-binding domain-containing protein [Candidatus Promineofilum sp.]|nr:PEP/pyruvate-binding domain-containing protein [Promineifilum sp.]MCW5863330.1 PEP/pyruvate-binding domain-containing protein [Anaerolineae bacterium]
MAPTPRSATPTIDIYIKLAQYPMLADTIRQRMRQELFRRGVISEDAFEQQVREKAIESQHRERLTDPYGQEEAQVWQKRKARVRDFQTDAYFADNFGVVPLEQLIQEMLHRQPSPAPTTELSFNPEVAPWEVLFRQGELYEQLPPAERQNVQHHLEEIKVVLIKRMISDQLPYIGIAKRIFTIADLRYIFDRRIGSGKIGGKAAGLMLAWRILQGEPGETDEPRPPIGIPRSFFIGTEVIYEFRLINGLEHFMNQKYRSLADIREEYPRIVEAHLEGNFSPTIVNQLRAVLASMGDRPLVVRSSSLLEDNFGFAFAGKYASYFCPNQGTAEENLHDLLDAVRLVYASTLNPDAILYRQKHGLIDYDERMAILIQEAIGHRTGRYYFPTLAGVAFSQNPFRWNNRIRREDGFLRLVWGFGTRAVERVSNDFPRLIALSHPQLRPETTARAIRQHSQWSIDVIDLEDNLFKTVSILDVLNSGYPFLRHIASINRGDYMEEIMSLGARRGDDEYVLTFNTLTRDRRFVDLMRGALQRLEATYGRPVDMEFTVDIVPNYPQTDYRLHVLQCRPLSQRAEGGPVTIPRDIPPEDILFTSHHLVPDGRADNVRYIVYVDPQRYYALHDTTVRQELARAVGRLNKRLENERFILMGPGRWGSANIELGVHVTYADIFNTKVLIEMAVAHNGHMPELSYGTHFFQDLVEAGIHSLALRIGSGPGGSSFNWAFFADTPNALADLLPSEAGLADVLKVIDLDALSGGRRLQVLMDGHHDEAIGYLT